ncbi:hypothetical protein SC22_11450 [Bacillus sp. A053]|uniref:hypothetical protein n=1 Tax=Bacillus TaxID=1386 RepID=UPI000589B131|nr:MULTISPECIES: hypothetical protein [Bacillus]ASB61179.1 hypothetical protein CDO84_09345 [Bacillus sp. MD-5]KIH39290.1 hypothetical protein SC22_11450 [Bacillus sp. A053]MDL9994139.1 hypothetical protein [Bacillus stercoris]
MYSEENNLETFKKIINQIYELITAKPDFGNPTTSTMVQLCHPGIPINENDYKNAMSRSNPSGDISTAVAFSKLVDNIPKCGVASYTPSGNSVDLAFGTCIQANGTSEPDPEQLKKYQDAKKYLWKSEQMTDMDGNVIQLPEVPTQVYQDYLNSLEKYNIAEEKVTALKNKCDMNTTEGRNRYAQESVPLIRRRDQALAEWNSKRPPIDQAFNVMATTLNDVTRFGIRRAQEIYEQSKVTDPATNQLVHVSFATPSNWYDPAMADNMALIEVSHRVKDLTVTDYYESYRVGASFGWGLWSVGGSGGHTTQEHTEHSTSTDVEICFKIGSIQIERPWMDMTFFKLGGWYLSGQKAGVISSGRAPNTDAEILPQMPVQILVAREIEIKASWSEREKEIIKEATSGGASIGYGCFKLSGSYESSQSTETFHSEFDGTTIKVPGIQIIGFVSSIPVPLCPPIDDPDINSLAKAPIGSQRWELKQKTELPKT